MRVERVRVGEVLRLERRPVTPDSLRDYELIGVYSWGKGIFHREPRPGAELGNFRFFGIHPGDLVLSNIQAWEGAIGVARNVDSKAIGTHRFLTYAPVEDRIDTTWAKWFFLSEAGMRLIRSASPGTTMRNRTLAIDRFEALEIPLPPIGEQRHIARRLDTVEVATGDLGRLRDRATELAMALPLAVCVEAQRRLPRSRTRLGDVLELVRDPILVDPVALYVSIGIRSFGGGLFHYPERPGAEIGQLRFHKVHPGLLAISNIKAWEGAVATSNERDDDTVASNRFLFLRPIAGRDATDFFWARLLERDGLEALGRASPGSADRNRTLAIDRFKEIRLELPDLNDQAAIGRQVHAARLAHFEHRAITQVAGARVDALLPAALNEVFAGIS